MRYEMTLEELLALVEQANNADALAAMSREDAEALRDQLQAAYDEYRPQVTTSDEVEALRSVAEAKLAVQGRIDAIDGEEQAVEDALAALDEQMSDTGPADGEGDEGEGSEGAGDDTQPGETGDNGDTPAEEAAPAPDAQGERVSAASRADLSALANTRQRQAPATETVVPESRIVASGHFTRAPVGSVVSLDTLGEELSHLHGEMQTLTPEQLPRDRFGRITERAGGRKVVLGTVRIADRPGVVFQQDGDGREIIDRAVSEYVAERDRRLVHNQRVVASGGDCVLAQPDYSINVVGERGTCFTDDLPTVAGNRPLTYYPWFKIDQSNGATGTGSGVLAREGIDFVTSEQDGAGYGDPDIVDDIPEGGAAYKSCVHIDCPDEPLTCSQEAVYKCVTLGNFQAISHPEYVDAFQTYMDIFWDIERDNRALDSFKAEAAAQNHMLTSGSADLQFGAVSSLKDIFTRLLAKERSARHAPNLSLNVVAPEWFGGFLALDVMLRAYGNLDNLRVTQAEALSLASTDGIRMSTYCTEAGPTAIDAQRMVLPPIGTGTVPAWPNSVRLLMYPDGAVFKKTAGDLRFGLRETLMKTNDFGMFQEVFEKVCYRGDVYVLDVELCANGATGAPVAKVCS
jgi:hypothetical protein